LPIILQVIHGKHTMFDFGIACIYGVVSLGFSLLGSYAIAMRRGAESLDVRWQERIRQRDEELGAEKDRIEKLNAQVEDLKEKPTRTPFQKKEFQSIKSTVDGDSEQCKSVLRCLMRRGKLTRNAVGKIVHLPVGLTEAQTVEALTVLESQHLVVPSGQWIQNGYETTWEIPEKIELMLEELL